MLIESQAPAVLSLQELKEQSIGRLAEMAKAYRIESPLSMRKQELIFRPGGPGAAGGMFFAEGVLEVLPDGFGFLQRPGP